MPPHDSRNDALRAALGVLALSLGVVADPVEALANTPKTHRHHRHHHAPPGGVALNKAKTAAAPAPTDPTGPITVNKSKLTDAPQPRTQK